MRVRVRLRLAGLLSATSVAGLLVLSATAAGAQSSPPPSESAAAALSASASLTTSSASGAGHSNVGNTHSPLLEKQLAGPSGSGIYSPAESPIAGAVQGIDISSHQHDSGSIDWSKVAADPGNIQFVAVKATEGDYYTNKYALNDLAAAKAAGLSVMAYAFAIPNGNGSSASPVTQANDLLNYLATGTVGVPPIMLDIEYNPYGAECYGLSQPAMVTWIKSFDAQIQKKTGSLPLIYTTAGWWQTCTGNSTALGQAPLWIAQYGSVSSPALPAGWKSWDFWQYTSKGTVSGITGDVDLDQLHPGTVPLLNPGDQPQVAGGPVDMQVRTADPIAGQALSYTASGLPGGVSLNAATGQITGWISKAGAYQITVTATDSQNDLGSVTFTWTAGNAPVQASGELHLNVGGKCLQDVGDQSVAGTQASIWTCNGSDAEQWSYAQDETLRIHGLCLSTASTAKDGTRPSLQQCTSTLGQRWRIVYPRGENPSAGTRPIGFVNVGSGKCLADPNWSKTNGTRVVISTCNGYTNQEWRLPGGPLRSELGKCADDSGGAATPGTPVVLWACNGTAEQAWTARQDGTVKVNGLCLEVSGGAVASGTPVDLATCDATAPAQQWHLVPDGGGVDLVNPQSNLCLASPGDTRVGGTQFQVLTCTPGDPGMLWRAS